MLVVIYVENFLNKIFHKIEVEIKFFLKKLASTMPVNFYQRPLAFSIIRNEFPSLQNVVVRPKREMLWDDALEMISREARSDEISYVEFGVLEGYSIKYFANKNKNRNPFFVGLDSFEGLPDDWDSIPRGTLDVGGVIPEVNDSRVTFLKGWFQDTAPNLMRQLDSRKSNSLIVNFDADLYSSTLYALAQMDTLKCDYYAFFDEFAGHESRALFNYIQSHNAKVTFLGKVMHEYQPLCVLCKIEPHKPAV